MNSKKEEMRSEYSSELINSGVRGKFAAKYKKGTNVVLIEPELQKLFPDTESVNKALKEYAQEHQLARP
ncbi:hypothetical protein [Alteromonas oceanisediminis]|uniref:hypothetical protein n=1 Tax=Alteromonas oceanisediminis TaxID=2836180 RepID=UPI001BDB5C72|nr:hypothetical protein [Alteromonas oceanisediminis]MBT0588175.1 hypothetical protein [Alteromonas oceanisediminis]